MKFKLSTQNSLRCLTCLKQKHLGSEEHYRYSQNVIPSTLSLLLLLPLQEGQIKMEANL
jgi:hypothetical protein